VTNLHNDYAVLAVQGPLAPKVLEALAVNTDIDYMAFAHVNIAGADVILCRTGYTGELGYELLPQAKDAVIVWENGIIEGKRSQWKRSKVTLM
jgi:aminomethyltransferase